MTNYSEYTQQCLCHTHDQWIVEHIEQNWMPGAEERAAQSHLFRRNNVEFHEDYVNQDVKDVCRYTAVYIRTLHNSPIKAELLDITVKRMTSVTGTDK